MGILVLPHSARDGCMDRWLARLAVWPACFLREVWEGLGKLRKALGKLRKAWEAVGRLGEEA